MESKKKLLIICYATYFLAGFTLSMRTNIFLFVQQDYLDGYQHIANLVLFSGVAMQLALFVTGNLIEKIGFQRVLPVALLSSGIPLTIMFFVNNIVLFDISMFVYMFGFGVITFLLNMFVSYLNPEKKGNALVLLHLFFALGALFGPKYVSSLTDAGMRWQTVLLLASIPFYIVFILFLTIDEEYISAGIKDSSKPLNHDNQKISRYFRDIFFWLFLLTFITSQVWEFGLGTWFVIFANKAKGLSSGEAAFYLTIFYFTYPVIRLIFAKVIHNFDLIVVLIGAFINCFVFSFLGMVTENMVFYSLTGAGIALMYPTIMASMQLIFGEGSLKKISFITMTGGLIQFVLIWLVGLLSDRYGIVLGFNFMIIYVFIGLLSSITILLLNRRGRRVKGMNP